MELCLQAWSHVDRHKTQSNATHNKYKVSTLNNTIYNNTVHIITRTKIQQDEASDLRDPLQGSEKRCSPTIKTNEHAQKQLSKSKFTKWYLHVLLKHLSLIIATDNVKLTMQWKPVEDAWKSSTENFENLKHFSKKISMVNLSTKF